MSESHPLRAPVANRLLAALEPDEYERVASRFESIALPVKMSLLVPGRHVTHVYFPLSGVCSVTALMSNGTSVEVGIIDSEGVVGAHEALGGVAPVNCCYVQIEGEAVRVPATLFREEFARHGTLQRVTLEWMQTFVSQISQTAACNRLHSVEQRLARWLLMCHDRVDSNDIALTHEFLGVMLASPRPGITKAVGQLSADGLIATARANITIVDRVGLEATACECYEIVRERQGNGRGPHPAPRYRTHP